MKYTVKVELEVEIEFLDKDHLDENEQDDVNDLIIEALSNSAVDITQNIFNEMEEQTHVEVREAFTFDEKVDN